MAASDSLFDSRGRPTKFSGQAIQRRHSIEIEGLRRLRDVAMATNFGTTLTVNGLGREITAWGFRIMDGLFSVNPKSLWSLSLDSYGCDGRNCCGRATVRLGIDTLIADILVLSLFAVGSV